jgi:hypothetical protein
MTDGGGAVVPQMDTDRPAGPVMPSFASLRDPGRRTAVDALFPAQQPPAAVAAAAPRPPEWTDLLHLAAHLARWSLHVPVRGLRRLLGG